MQIFMRWYITAAQHANILVQFVMQMFALELHTEYFA